MISNKVVPIALFIGLIFTVSTISGTVNGATIQSPKADFLAVHTHGQAPFKVHFQDKSTNNPTSYTWYFGDGTTSNSKSKNVYHTYQKPGIYSVQLAVKNSAGSGSQVRPKYIFVTKYAAPHANFKASPTHGKAPLTVHFTDTSKTGVNIPTSWKWNFGNGKTSTDQNPTHTYTQPGKYTITLTAKNAQGTNTMQKKNYIIVK